MTAAQRNAAAVELITAGDAALITIGGIVDERFVGFGDIGSVTVLVIDVGGVTRITSFGVRQWLVAIEKLQSTIAHLYLLACPTFFVDQLNMVANFVGHGRVLTAAAPYLCPQCGTESTEMIDVVVDHQVLAAAAPMRVCSRCGARLELDEAPESYFAFCANHGAVDVVPAAASLLEAQGLYKVATTDHRAPEIVKEVHGTRTTFAVKGALTSAFRARAFSGATNEITIDLAAVDRFEPSAQREWRRMIQTLARQASSLRFVDVPASLLAVAVDSLIAETVSVDSVRAPYQCLGCGRIENLRRSPHDAFTDTTCSACGAVSRCRLSSEVITTMRQIHARPPPTEPESPIPAPERYEILRRLSSSNTADVFLATAGDASASVALKRFRAAGMAPSMPTLERARRLKHPNLVQVLDVVSAREVVSIALEYVHGKDLKAVQEALVAQGEQMALGDVCYIVREIARAVVYVRGVDADIDIPLEAQNVLLSSKGVVKLLGVGTASEPAPLLRPSDAEAVRTMLLALADGRALPGAWSQPDVPSDHLADVVDGLGRVMRDPIFDSSAQQIAELVSRALEVTHVPVVTDGASVKIGAPDRGSTRRSKPTLTQSPALPRLKPPTSPPAVRPREGSLPRGPLFDAFINFAIVIAIVAIAIVGAYFILSRS